MEQWRTQRGVPGLYSRGCSGQDPAVAVTRLRTPRRGANTPRAREAAAGRAAAERLSDAWPDVSWVPEAPTEPWANAAVERFAELIREQRAIFRASQRGAERGAASLSPRPFQGILEALQNADDLHAKELRIAVRVRGRKRELLMAHDGDRVRLDHVGAMVLPWLTTKEDDPDASGRFGIGQKTLSSLGGPLEVHCAPFQFRIEADGPVVSSPVAPIKGFYTPSRHETLFVVPLLRSVDLDDLRRFVAERLGPRSLVFLQSVRRLSFVRLPSAERVTDHLLVGEETTSLNLRVGDRRLPTTRLELREPRSRRRWVRYLVDGPLSREEQRHEKATGKTTPLGVAFPLGRATPSGFYDRLPLPLESGFTFSVNAQFDPDTARSALLENDWNARRIRDLGQLVAAVALDAFVRDPASAWRAVPLEHEVQADENSWFEAQLHKGIVDIAQAHVREHLKLKIRNRRRGLGQLVYEDEELDGLLTTDDQEDLCAHRSAVPMEYRDPAGRWRRILEELALSTSIGVDDALTLLERDDDELGARTSSWYIGMARAAIDAGLFDEFLQSRGVLLSDGRRIEPPGDSDPRSLVRRVDKRSLAAALDVALPIHHDYLQSEPDAQRVAEELAEWDILIDECNTADGVLRVLARDYAGNTIGRVRVDDDQLVLLRDAFERLDETDQKALGPRIGRNIELRGFEYDWSGIRTEDWVSPAEAYLPKEIDRETDSFARAAGETPGISWLDSRYAKLLKREGGRTELGAQKLLSRLGAALAPRLEAPTNERSPWRADRRPGSKIDGVWRPPRQKLEINALSPRRTYLLNDRWSPDLAAVIDDIVADEEEPERQRRRGLALLGVLARVWERQYADHHHAQAVYASGGYWLDERDVTATWLARASSEAWLPSADGTMTEPQELCLPTEANRLVHADSGSMFLADVDEDLLRSPALLALGLRRGPSARTLVERLQELRQHTLTEELAEEVRTAYKLLALACPPEGARRPVDDVGVAELRTMFGGGRGRRGLILVEGRWYRPRDVFGGDPIFGRHRAFVPGGRAYAPLWRTLGINEPRAADCLAVLKELAKRPLEEDDRAVVLAAFRALGRTLADLSTQARSQLRKLPLWTGSRWRTARPVYVLEDPELAAQVARRVPVWESGLASYSDLGELLDALEVTILHAADFSPVTLDGRGVVAGEDLRHRFALAVEHLHEELFRGDEALHDSLAVRWRELAAATIVVEPNLELTADANGKRLVVQAHAHVRRDPLAFIVRSADDAASAEAGGAALASLFEGDRQKVAWAWTSMWNRASDNIAPERIVLAESENDDDGGGERLVDLQGQAKSRQRSRRRAGRPATGDGTKASGAAIQVKPLKDLAEYRPDDGAVVNAGVSAGGVMFPPALNKASEGDDGRGDGQRRERAAKSETRVPTKSVLPPLDAREQLALDAVMDALRLDAPQVVDLRHRRGIGADMVDELRQAFEIKMSSSGDFPSEVTLTRSEVERAQNDADFFLALVSGLEDAASELRVRFIFNPFERLAVRIRGEVTLSGLRDAEALEYRFSKTIDGSATAT